MELFRFRDFYQTMRRTGDCGWFERDNLWEGTHNTTHCDDFPLSFPIWFWICFSVIYPFVGNHKNDQTTTTKHPKTISTNSIVSIFFLCFLFRRNCPVCVPFEEYILCILLSAVWQRETTRNIFLVASTHTGAHRKKWKEERQQQNISGDDIHWCLLAFCWLIFISSIGLSLSVSLCFRCVLWWANGN